MKKALSRKLSRGNMLTKAQSIQASPSLKAEESSREVSIGYASREGQSHKNEDRVDSKMKLNDTVSGYVGVFDGHGGDKCSDFMSKVMGSVVAEHFQDAEAWDRGEDVFRDMFHQLDEDYCNQAMKEDDTSGSCATVVVVRNDEALVANIGDCRAIIVVENGKPISVTEEHRAELEEKRISAAGGKVSNGRIGNLSPSRVFGDIDVKSMVPAGVVIPTPNIERLKLEGKSGFIVVASDGVWDYLSNTEVKKYVSKALKSSNNDPQVAAEKLVKIASVDRKSHDDVTAAVVVW